MSMHVNVRIRDFIIGSPITDNQQHSVSAGPIQEPVPVGSAGGKASAHAAAKEFFSRVRFQDDFTRQHIDELVLTRMPVSARRLPSGHDPRDVDPKVRQSRVVTEPSIPATLVLSRICLGVTGGVALRQFERIKPRWFVGRHRYGPAASVGSICHYSSGALLKSQPPKRAARMQAAETELEVWVQNGTKSMRSRPPLDKCTYDCASCVKTNPQRNGLRVDLTQRAS